MKKNFKRTTSPTLNFVCSIALIIIISATLVVVDYFNLPSVLGLKMYSLNWEFLAIILNAIVIILLYIVTYFALDKKSIDREKNKNEIAIMLINKTYEDVKKQSNMMTIDTVRKYILPKIDFNSVENTVISNITALPFINENLILELAKEGHISKNVLEDYFSVKESYSVYINSIVTFFDASDLYIPMKNELDQTIQKAANTLKKSNKN